MNEKKTKDYDVVRGASFAVRDAAKQLRQRQTDAEAVLWNALRNSRLHGLKFRRQYPVGKFVLDFFCRSCNLVTEVDGGIHDELQERDEERTRVLESYGYNVLRITNDEVLNDLENVLNRIATTAQHQSLSRTPLPELGEG
jgi:very-short-patch-repair endonuclease